MKKIYYFNVTSDFFPLKKPLGLDLVINKQLISNFIIIHLIKFHGIVSLNKTFRSISWSKIIESIFFNRLFFKGGEKSRSLDCTSRFSHPARFGFHDDFLSPIRYQMDKFACVFRKRKIFQSLNSQQAMQTQRYAMGTQECYAGCIIDSFFSLFLLFSEKKVFLKWQETQFCVCFGVKDGCLCVKDGFKTRVFRHSNVVKVTAETIHISDDKPMDSFHLSITELVCDPKHVVNP